MHLEQLTKYLLKMGDTVVMGSKNCVDHFGPECLTKTNSGMGELFISQEPIGLSTIEFISTSSSGRFRQIRNLLTMRRNGI